jgi:hypothetical protein
MRANYRRLKGTEQFFGFYDVHADCLDGLFRKRKRLPELFEAFQRLRRCYPRKKLFVIMDNLHQVHDHPRSSRCSSGFASTPCGPPPRRTVVFAGVKAWPVNPQVVGSSLIRGANSIEVKARRQPGFFVSERKLGLYALVRAASHYVTNSSSSPRVTNSPCSRTGLPMSL